MSTMNENSQYLKNLKKCSNDQSFHFCEGQLSNSFDLINSLDSSLHWTNLTSLNLSSNKLRDITLLINAVKLEILNLSNNFLDDISSIISCEKLISLDFSMNNIHELPELNKLPFLERLNASHNPLASISGLWGCMSLRCLDLTSCQLSSCLLTGLNEDEIQLGLIDPLERSNNLSTYLKQRNLSTVRPTFLGIPHLRILNLSYNPKISHAISIQLTSNEWHSIQKALYDKNFTGNQHHSESSLFNESTKDLKSNDSSGFGLLPYKIQHLNLQACDIHALDGLTLMKRLHTLNLSQNQIIDHQTLMPLKSLTCLQNLNLKNNPICDQNNYFGKIIFNLKHLKILDDRHVSIKDKVSDNFDDDDDNY
ncbi:unnamed protein product [Schistosoma turkestanicum]|nr:unnamed protein product [Schistosoma turkestanicum]